jgi:hypothetical protein
MACGAAAHADHALVVGVDKYKNISGHDLDGCVSDAKGVAERLAALGFQVTLLTDGQASREGILAALARMAAANKANERFVFYFAGHGSGGSPATILTNTSLADGPANDIPADDLTAAVLKVPASARTILLDSCFSGGMPRSARGKIRMFERATENAKDLKIVSAANGQDVPSKMQPDDGTQIAMQAKSGICYFTAARDNEYAQEDVFGGTHHGVFTYCLLSGLKGGSGTWNQVQGPVSANVSEKTEDKQHPTLTPAFVNKPVFGAPAAPPSSEPEGAHHKKDMLSIAPSTNMMALISMDNVNHDALMVTMEPDKSTVAVGEQVRFRIHAGRAGYLVLIEHGTSGRVNLLFPETGSAEDAKVTGGQDVRIPSDPGYRYAPDAAGNERLRALLFNSKDDARTVIDALVSAGAGAKGTSGAEFNTLLKSLKRDLVRQRVIQFYTSDIHFAVVPR